MIVLPKRLTDCSEEDLREPLADARQELWGLWGILATPAMQVALDGALEGRVQRPHHVGYTWAGAFGCPPFLSLTDVVRWTVPAQGPEMVPGVSITHDANDVLVRDYVSRMAPEVWETLRTIRGLHPRTKRGTEARRVWADLVRDLDNPFPELCESHRVSAWPTSRRRWEVLLDLYGRSIPVTTPPSLHGGVRYRMTWELLAALKGDTAPLDQLLGPNAVLALDMETRCQPS